jgi:hypothetical protein
VKFQEFNGSKALARAIGGIASHDCVDFERHTRPEFTQSWERAGISGQGERLDA